MTELITKTASFNKELESRGISNTVGHLNGHTITIGKGEPIDLEKIKTNKIPYAGFFKATKIQRGKAGLRQTSKSLLQSMIKTDGGFNAKSILKDLKTHFTHYQRLQKLNSLTDTQQNDYSWSFRSAVRSLSNKELSAVFQCFTSPQMDLLQSSLLFVGKNDQKNQDAADWGEMLFDLKAVVISEIGNRYLNEQIDNAAKQGGLDEGKGSQEILLLSEKFKSRTPQRQASPHDLTASNLASLTEVGTLSQTSREKDSVKEQTKLHKRRIDNINLNDVGDRLRKTELTMNIKTAFLIGGPNSVFDHPETPLVNIHTLKEQGLVDNRPGYIQLRENVENTMFPELKGHEVKGKERPIYGALNTMNLKEGAAPIYYGKSVIVFKESVKKRATFTVGDSFTQTAITVNQEKRENFYKLLPGVEGIPQELKDILANPNSQPRKDLDAFFDQLAASDEAGVRLLNHEALPESIKNIFLRNHQTIESEQSHETTEQYKFQAFMVKVFGDAAKAGQQTVNYDNLEMVMPKLTELGGNDLAHATIEAKSGTQSDFFITGAEYIEVQIHGPVIPSQDIEEIRVYLDEIPEDEQEGFKVKARNYSQRTGIKITFMDEEGINEDKAVREAAAFPKSLAFNAQHLDEDAVNQSTQQFLMSLKDKVDQRVRERSRFAHTPYLTLDGAALNRLAGKIQQRVADLLRKKGPHGFSSHNLVENIFTDLVMPMLEHKQKLLNEMQKYPFNEAQKKAVANWIVSAKALDSVEEFNLVMKHAMINANVIREVSGARPPKTPAEILSIMSNSVSAFNLDFKPYFAGLEQKGKEVGPDDVNTEYNRISFMSLALLQHGEPPLGEEELKTLAHNLNSPDIRALNSQLSAVRSNKEVISNTNDSDTLEDIDGLMMLNAQNASVLAKERYVYPDEFQGPLSLIPQTTREVLRALVPDTVKYLDEQHPGYAPMVSPAHPENLPQNDGQRRQFCVSVLGKYVEHEKTFERGTSIHGRGHIARSFIFSNVMCNILQDRFGIKVDKNAVMCGIAGHDMGRKKGNEDQWEEDSAQLTVNAMQQQYGNDTLGADYQHQLEGCINSQSPHHNTVEAMVLKAADSLDIGRTATFKPELFPFLKGKAGETQTKEVKELRDQLIREADILQRLTDPACGHKDVIKHYTEHMMDEYTSIEMQLFYSDKKEELAQDIAKDYEKDWQLSDEEYLQKVENYVKNNPKLFPLLNKYYTAA